MAKCKYCEARFSSLVEIEDHEKHCPNRKEIRSDVIKTLQLGGCKTPIEAAVGFEMALAEIIEHYMGCGLSVSNAVGVLTCVTSEITISFNLNRGMADNRIKQVAG